MRRQPTSTVLPIFSDMATKWHNFYVVHYTQIQPGTGKYAEIRLHKLLFVVTRKISATGPNMKVENDNDVASGTPHNTQNKKSSLSEFFVFSGV